MIETAHRNTVHWPLLGSIQEGGPLLWWRLVVVYVPQELHLVSIRSSELVGPAMAQVALNPALAQSSGLDGFGPPLQCLGRGGPPGHMPHSGLHRLSYFQGVMIKVFIRSQIDRLSLPTRLLQSKQLFEEPQGIIGFRSEQLHVSKLSYLE